MRLSLQNCTTLYRVKPFTEPDLPDIYAFCKANTRYYQYMRLEPTLENLKEIFTELPPGKTSEDKYFVGFYQENQLIALLDLCTGYPRKDVAYIGWFMIDKALQHKGIGTKILAGLLGFLKNKGFRYVELACIKANKEALQFWQKNGFSPTGREAAAVSYVLVTMQKSLN